MPCRISVPNLFRSLFPLVFPNSDRTVVWILCNPLFLLDAGLCFLVGPQWPG